MASFSNLTEVLQARIYKCRARLLGTSTFLFILLMALMLVNVHVHQNVVDTAIWQFFISLRMGWLNPIVENFTNAFGTIPDTIYALVAIGLICWKRRSAWPLATIGLSMILAPLAMVAIKNIVDRSRPPLIDRLVNETSFSFPSGHSTGIAALCVSIFLALLPLLERRGRVIAGILLGFLALLVAYSRLYVGVHWGSDILGGLSLGTAVTCAINGVFVRSLVKIQS